MSNIYIYPKELVPENFFFQWPSSTKIHCIYHMHLKEEHGDC